AKKPKLKVGGKKVKILLFTDSEIQFEVPKLANGFFDIFLTNKVGADTEVGGFTVKGSSVGFPSKDFVKCKVNGSAFYASGGLTGSIISTAGSFSIGLATDNDGSPLDLTTKQLSLSIFGD